VLPKGVFDRLRLPIIGSPLCFISGSELVIAQRKMEFGGSFPTLNARPQSLLHVRPHRLTEELRAFDRADPDRPSAPFAVNEIVHRSNPRMEEDLAICANRKVPIVITSGARVDINLEIRRWGGLTLRDVIDDRFARKAIENGAIGLIAVAAGPGGHAGSRAPAALFRKSTAGWTNHWRSPAPSRPSASNWADAASRRGPGRTNRNGRVPRKTVPALRRPGISGH
jgi:nitronate monooxygenase